MCALPSPDNRAKPVRLQSGSHWHHRRSTHEALRARSRHDHGSRDLLPHGHVFALFPDEESARAAGQALQSRGRDEVAHATPTVILEQVVRTLGNADEPLPSVGAEGVIVRRMAQLASNGAHGLLLPALDSDLPQTLRDLLQPLGPLAAFYYRRLVIEELVPAAA